MTRAGRVAYARAMALDARRARLTTHVADVDGLRMTYHEGGPTDAPTIVMLHGYTANRHLWSRFARHLDKDFHVVIPDLAGHGDTPFVTGAGYSTAAQAGRVATLLDHLGIDKVHIIGNSMGGFTAAQFAHTFPERTLSLGVNDAPGVKAPSLNELSRMIDRGENPFLFTDPARFDAFYAMTMAKPPFLPRFVKKWIASDYVARQPAHTEIFADFAEVGMLDDALGAITMPSWVSWGSEDEIVDPSTAAVWADGLPNSTLTVYSGIGHMPMMEIPKRMARDYRAFLDSVTP